MRKVVIKLNQPMNNYPTGYLITVEADENNLPIDPFWRSRIHDAQQDHCCEILAEPKKKQKSKEGDVNEPIQS